MMVDYLTPRGWPGGVGMGPWTVVLSRSLVRILPVLTILVLSQSI